MGKASSKQTINFPQSKLVPCFTLDKEGAKSFEGKTMFLEKASADDRKVKGIIVVKDFDHLEENFEVKVRFTLNSWKSFDDIFCEHLKEEKQETRNTKRFKFELDVPNDMTLEFAICCRNTTNSSEIWDNYNERNYKFTDMVTSKN